MKLIRRSDEVIGIKFVGGLENLIEMRESFGSKFENYTYKADGGKYDKLGLSYTNLKDNVANIRDRIVLSNGYMQIIKDKYINNYYSMTGDIS